MKSVHPAASPFHEHFKYGSFLDSEVIVPANDVELPEGAQVVLVGSSPRPQDVHEKVRSHPRHGSRNRLPEVSSSKLKLGPSSHRSSSATSINDWVASWLSLWPLQAESLRTMTLDFAGSTCRLGQLQKKLNFLTREAPWPTITTSLRRLSGIR